MKKKVLIVAAHPDDEVIGCGGTIVRHVMAGDEVHVVFMTNGESSRIDLNCESNIVNRHQAAIDVSRLLNICTTQFFDLPDNKMDTIPLLDVVRLLESTIMKIEPSVVYTHYANDLNIDHCITHRAVMTACRPQPGCCVREIYSFEILSSTGWGGASPNSSFEPNYFVDISNVWRKKVDVLNIYNFEMRSFPHARSVEGIQALATLRGVSVGVSFAESFKVERIII